MRVLRITIQFAAFIMMFLFMACTSTSTKFSTIWKDETYHGRPKKILVIDLFQNPSIRRLFEDEIVKALKDRKVDAVLQYSIVTDAIVSDTEAVAALAKEAGADTVLITRPAGTRQDVTGSLTGRAISSVYINIQTDVYDMKTNKLISFASAETKIKVNSSDLEDYLNSVPAFVKDLVKKLSQTGLL